MTQFNATTYDIERPTGRCAFTDEPLAPGEAYMATLVDLDPEQQTSAEPPKSAAAALGFKRLDVSWRAWQEGKRPERLFSHWKSVVPEPNQKRKIFVDDAVLMNLFRRLAEETQPQRVAFRFVVGLILMRKKFLRYDGTARRSVPNEAGEPVRQDWWQVTPKLDLSNGPMGKWNEEDALEMLDPHLDDQQVEQVTQQLGEILEAEL